MSQDQIDKAVETVEKAIDATQKAFNEWQISVAKAESASSNFSGSGRKLLNRKDLLVHRANEATIASIALMDKVNEARIAYTQLVEAVRAVDR